MLKLKLPPGYELWSEVKLVGKNIHPRSYHSAVLLENQLFIYGGYEVHEGILSDFHYLDFSEFSQMQWSELTTIEANYPGPRWRHTMVAYDKKLYLFGGQITTTQNTAALHCYDFNQWNVLESDFIWPIDSQNVIVLGDQMIVFGGYLGGEYGCYSNKIFSYQFQTNQWKHLQVKEGQAPEPRSSSGMTGQGDKVYVFGGTDGVSKFNDLWIFYLTKQEWCLFKKSSSPGSPNPRHGLSLVIHNNLLILFGGIRDVTREKNDLHVFDLEKVEWINLQSDFRSPMNEIQASPPTPLKLYLPPISQRPSEIRQQRRQLSYQRKSNTMSHNSSKKRSTTQQLSPLMAKIIKEYEEKVQTQLFFSMNVTLAIQQKRRLQLQRKAQFLKDLDVKNEKEKETLRVITPISGALRNSLHLIGVQEKVSPILTINKPDSTICSNDTRVFKGKIPCARDGHSATILNNSQLLIFGGDRHLMSFNDLYIFSLTECEKIIKP